MNIIKLLTLSAIAVAFVLPAHADTTVVKHKKKKVSYTSVTRASVSSREETVRSSFALGLHAGPNFSVSSFDATQPSQDTSGMTRLMMGASFEARVAQYIYGQPELNYVQRG